MLMIVTDLDEVTFFRRTTRKAGTCFSNRLPSTDVLNETGRLLGRPALVAKGFDALNRPCNSGGTRSVRLPVVGFRPVAENCLYCR